MFFYTIGLILICNIKLGVHPQGSSECEHIKCSMIYDPLCGLTITQSGKQLVSTFQNKCIYEQVKCEMGETAVILQMPHEVCHIKRPAPSRRMKDFTIIGAHQMCNHSCPIYCVDTYDPVCAQILNTKKGSKYRPMVNHCHVDMFSCATGANVSIHALSKCYSNAAGKNFMAQVAALKFMNLLEEPWAEKSPPAPESAGANGNRARTYIN